jgi:hypothetical protein
VPSPNYRREWIPFLRAAIGLTRRTFGMPWPATLLGAWLVLRANYGVDESSVRVAAEQRALAMRHSDRWVQEGRDLGSPLITEERAALVRSYAGLLAAVHRPA